MHWLSTQLPFCTPSFAGAATLCPAYATMRLLLLELPAFIALLAQPVSRHPKQTLGLCIYLENVEATYVLAC